MSKILDMLIQNPELVQEVIAGIVEQYKPILYAIGKELLNIYKDYANNTELAETKATARKNQYDAYISVGFSETEAMSLLLTDIRQVAELVEKNGKRKINFKHKN